jgi:ribonuclease P protein component
MRFRSEQHLRRPSDIRAVREHGQRIDCRAYTVWWKRRESAPAAAGTPTDPGAASTPRVCVIASTASVGVAVRRNRAKRRLREVFRHHQAAVPVDCDMLLIARVGAAEWPLPEMEKRFVDACRRIQGERPASAS